MFGPEVKGSPRRTRVEYNPTVEVCQSRRQLEAIVSIATRVELCPDSRVKKPQGIGVVSRRALPTSTDET